MTAALSLSPTRTKGTIISSIGNVLVIGSGPAGYTAALYLARAGLKPIVLAGMLEPGGALMTTTEVENYPGFATGVMGPDLMDTMREQAERFGARVIYEDAETVNLRGLVKAVTGSDGVVYESYAVVLAMGAAHRKLGVPGEEELSGRGVSYCATCDGFFFKDKNIFVVGGGDSAMEEALFLARFGSSVTVVHRRSELSASKTMADRALAHPKISFLWDTEVQAVGGDKVVEVLSLRNVSTGDQRHVNADALFIAVGHNPRSALVADDAATDADGYVQVFSPTTETNLPGVFACGDLVDRRYRQAITAAGSGCAAALDAERFLAEG